ncbi:MAG TPA: hypothetical protein VEL11_10200 [Candidatus Bathyarchaeia archaeon]|nr:hypothetical protein [Candidatus Bathyarchaeia archaeon]
MPFDILYLLIPSLQKLKELKKLSGEIEMDEALFGGDRKGKRGWGAERKSLVFGIYQRNGKDTFPVSNSLDKTPYKEGFLVLYR